MPFTLERKANIAEINSLVSLYSHDKTGARLMTVSNDDENKAFGITFPTPPASSNGIAHILEHSVLGGSKKYPVKEPFVELVKGSFKTFLNAMTFPDKTVYPVASTNLQDFYNLIDVYLDAVLHPRLTESKLQQEGWHYELASPDAPLTFKGVVFNEMKGEYSSPDRLSYEYSQRALFPDNAYGFDSGGDPAVIPDLMHGEFKAFHERYYHPSNAFIWFYGDDPEEERLKYLDTWLDEYDAGPADSLTDLQPRWDEPRREIHRYDSGGSPEAKSYLTVNWLLDGGTDVQTALGLGILSHILTGTPGSPLRKALMDSGLGDDLVGAGFQEDLLQMSFSEGLKGVATPDLPKVEALILETLDRLSSEGLDPDTVAASLNTIEFHLREQNTGQFPRGLALMFGALSRWIYGGDPIDALAFEGPLEAVKQDVRAAQTDGAEPGERYFEHLIRRYLLENPHRVTVSLEPDPEEGKRREQAEEARLAKAKSAMTAEQLQQVIENAAELKRLQETPNSPEALATLPYLKLSDLDAKIKTIPIEITRSRGGSASLLFHDLPTNGIVYLDLGFDLRALPPELLPYAGLFGRVLLEMGTRTEDYVKLSQRIGRDTGGIWAASLTAASAGAVRSGDDEKSALWFFLRGKAVATKTGALLDILRDVLLTARLDNRERFKQIVQEEKSGLEAALVPSGHGLVNSRLRARLSEEGWVSEQIGGIDHLFFLRALARQIEEDWPTVLDKLDKVQHLLVRRESMVANVTLEPKLRDVFGPQLESLLEALAASSVQLHAYPPSGEGGTQENEGLTIPAQVNYVGKGFNLFADGYELHGSALVATRYLRASYMWEKVRVQGGAYGGYSLFDPHSGAFTFLSYRDPNLLATLGAYDGAAEFLRGLDLSESELTKAIIGTISDLDAYLLPDAKGWTSMTRYLIGYSDVMRQQIRDEVLGTTAKDFHAFGEALAKAAIQGETVVLGSAEAIEKANAEKPGLLAVKKVM
jgi:presequence protease